LGNLCNNFLAAAAAGVLVIWN